MNHIALDNQEEAVKRFVLSLPADRSGSVLELNGQPIVCVVPADVVLEGENDNGDWTAAKNERRCDLIDRKYAGGITPAEVIELARLQEQMLRYRQRVAPLPLEDARKLHQELLELARSKSAS